MGPAEEVYVSEVGTRGGGQLGGRKPHGGHVEHGVLVPKYQNFRYPISRMCMAHGNLIMTEVYVQDDTEE